MKSFTPAVFFALMCGSCATAPWMLSSKDRIFFLGDSITEQGAGAGGFITIIRDSLSGRFPGLEFVGAGVSGNKITDLELRLERDVLSRKPTVVFVYIGINDVWHSILPGHQGTPVERFENGLRNVVSRIQRDGSIVIVCSPSVVGEKKHGGNPLDTQLDTYAGVSRRVALALNCRLCDLRKVFLDFIDRHNPEDAEKGVVTVDGVHLNAEGNRLVAESMLAALQAAHAGANP